MRTKLYPVHSKPSSLLQHTLSTVQLEAIDSVYTYSENESHTQILVSVLCKVRIPFVKDLVGLLFKLFDGVELD